jgi:hypothetical protein
VTESPDSPQGPVAEYEPQLDPEVVDDDVALAEVVDRQIHGNNLARTRLAEIPAHQDLLRQALDSETWKLALLIDELIVERWADVVVIIARHAYDAGRRFPLPLGEGST